MHYIFEFAIFFILFFSAYWIYIIVRSFFYDKKSGINTRIKRSAILIPLVLIFIFVFYGSFIEPRRLAITNVNINLNQADGSAKLKIAFISDMQLGPYKQAGYLTKIVDKIIALKPDIVLLGGDYIENKEAQAGYLAPLKNLADRFPVFSVTGNHEFNQSRPADKRYRDNTASLRKLFKEWNIEILDNANRILTVNGSNIAICGIEDIWTGRADLTKAGADIPAGIPKILLAHNPDIILDNKSEDFNLILSGHTHAGQFRLPWIGPIVPVPTNLGRAFDYGLFKLKNNYLYITSGLGESGARARLFCKPEIAIINLNL
ncbi:MAG: metallophosphoesterase [Parcubacteria group bacterium]